MIRKAVVVVLMLGVLGSGALWAWSHYQPTGYSFKCQVEYPNRQAEHQGGYEYRWRLRNGVVSGSYSWLRISRRAVRKSTRIDFNQHGFRLVFVQRLVTVWSETHVPTPIPLAVKDQYGYRSVRGAVPLWFPTVLLGVYPAVAFIRGPLRRWRRCKRGECIHCGYNLTGNVTGACSECGTKIESP